MQLGTKIELYSLSRPYASVYIIRQLCTLPLPYRRADKEELLPMIQDLWGLLKVSHNFLFCIVS